MIRQKRRKIITLTDIKQVFFSFIFFISVQRYFLTPFIFFYELFEADKRNVTKMMGWNMTREIFSSVESK